MISNVNEMTANSLWDMEKRRSRFIEGGLKKGAAVTDHRPTLQTNRLERIRCEYGN